MLAPPLTLSSKRSQNYQRVHYTIPIGKYFNRLAEKKVPTAKGQVRIQVTQQRLIVKQQRPQTKQWIEADSISIYDIDNIQDKQKTQDEYTLLKIQLKTVPQNEKQSKSITFRILSIPLGREVTAFINRTMAEIENSIKNLPNYATIENKQTIIMRSIILSEQQYMQVYKKSQQKRLFNPQRMIDVLEFQRTMLNGHQKMVEFNKFKHTLKYEQQKNILIEKLKNKQTKNNMTNNKFSLNSQHQNAAINLLQSTNIDKHEIDDDLNKIKKQGKQWLEGYSSKREFQGVNFTGGDDQLYMAKDMYGTRQDGQIQIRNENLILKNITLNESDRNQGYFDNNYNDFAIENLNKSNAKLRNTNENQKMELQQGQINENNHKHRQINICKKLKIPDSRDVKLQQKVQERKIQRKGQIKFIDPSYSPQKQRSLTKQTIIWCRLFYHFLKQGGVEKRERQLTAIEGQLKRLRHADHDVKMNESVSKMVQKVSFNFLRMKRGQDTY